MPFTYRISILGEDAASGALRRIIARTAEGQNLCATITRKMLLGGDYGSRLAIGERESSPGPADFVICLGAACGGACWGETGAESRFLLVARAREEESALLDLQKELERTGFRGKALPACPEAWPLYALGGALEELCAAGLFTLEELAEEAARDAPDQAQARLSDLERGMSAAPLHRCKGQASR